MFENTVFFGNPLSTIIIAFLITAAGIAASFLIKKLIDIVVKPFTEKTETDVDDIIIGIIQTPICFFTALYAIYYAHNLLTLSVKINSIMDKGYMISIVIMISIVGVQIVDLILYKVLTSITKKTEGEWDDHLVPIVRQVVKIVLVVFTLLTIASNFGFNITSIVAGLGIGGLAFAFAAQDIIKNLFGGISVFMDKPFKPGDFIKIAGVEGTVVEVGLRTTKLKTLDNRFLTIPNAKITENVIENVTSEDARKIIANLGLTYETSSKKIEEGVKIIKDVMKNNKFTKDECDVAFNKFGDFSLNLIVVYWIKDKTKILDAQHEVNMQIKEKFEKAKIEFAFPTQTIITKRK
ncbi:MAG: mechanosensitive ion channel family protein [Candidatus Woesearchaeota archaeon]|jgi:MscS family membrane protein